MMNDSPRYRMPDGRVAIVAQTFGWKIFAPAWEQFGKPRAKRIKSADLPAWSCDRADLAAKLGEWARARGGVEITASQVYAAAAASDLTTRVDRVGECHDHAAAAPEHPSALTFLTSACPEGASAPSAACGVGGSGEICPATFTIQNDHGMDRSPELQPSGVAGRNDLAVKA